MPKKARRSERDEQRALVAWFKLQYPGELLFAIPNQLVRGKLGALVAVRDGVVAGMPDVMVACSRGGYHGLFIELKRADGGILSVEQHGIISFLIERGYLAMCCHGFEDARMAVEEYMRGNRICY
jgi:hypothetical protein